MEEKNREMQEKKPAEEALKKRTKWGRRAMVAGGGILLLLALAKSPFMQKEMNYQFPARREVQKEIQSKKPWFEAPMHRYVEMTPAELDTVRNFLEKKYVQDSLKFTVLPNGTKVFSLIPKKSKDSVNTVKLKDIFVSDERRTFVDKTSIPRKIALGQMVLDSTGFHVAIDPISLETGKTKDSIVKISQGFEIRKKLKDK
ncbi:hypothetical protein HY989_04050 [Candidatus Micrarchaeota archaeon]|nr:hypothetical protein [Candidatus Micrarchaeota archaeon]